MVASAAPVPLFGRRVLIRCAFPHWPWPLRRPPSARMVERCRRSPRRRRSAPISPVWWTPRRRARSRPPTPATSLNISYPADYPDVAGRVRLRQADPRRIPQRGQDARPARHALRAGHDGHASTTRRCRPAAPSRWCSRSTRTSAAPTRRPSTSRSTGTRAFAQADHRSTTLFRRAPSRCPSSCRWCRAELEKQFGQAGDDRARGRPRPDEVPELRHHQRRARSSSSARASCCRKRRARCRCRSRAAPVDAMIA